MIRAHRRHIDNFTTIIKENFISIILLAGIIGDIPVCPDHMTIIIYMRLIIVIIIICKAYGICAVIEEKLYVIRFAVNHCRKYHPSIIIQLCAAVRGTVDNFIICKPNGNGISVFNKVEFSKSIQLEIIPIFINTIDISFVNHCFSVFGGFRKHNEITRINVSPMPVDGSII